MVNDDSVVGLKDDMAIVCNLCGFWIDSSDAGLKVRVMFAHVAHFHPDAMALAEMEQQFRNNDHDDGGVTHDEH